MNQIIEVPDIAVVKVISGVKQLCSLRSQKIVKNQTLQNFGAGSGVMYAGNLYILSKKRIAKFVAHANVDKLIIKIRSDIEISWGDGNIETVRASTDNIVLSHSFHPSGDWIIEMYGNNDALIYLDGGQYFNSVDVEQCTSLNYLETMSVETVNVKGCFSLKTLDLNGTVVKTNLTNIDLSDCINLEYLNISFCEIQALDISMCNALNLLICPENPIVTNKDTTNLISMAQGLPNRNGLVAGRLQIGNLEKENVIRDICSSKNWTIFR